MKKLLLNAVALGLLLFAVSCESRSERTFRNAQESKQATQVVESSVEKIIIETLHSGSLVGGVHRITIDGVEYIVVVNFQNSIAITRHGFSK